MATQAAALQCRGAAAVHQASTQGAGRNAVEVVNSGHGLPWQRIQSKLDPCRHRNPGRRVQGQTDAPGPAPAWRRTLVRAWTRSIPAAGQAPPMPTVTRPVPAHCVQGCASLPLPVPPHARQVSSPVPGVPGAASSPGASGAGALEGTDACAALPAGGAAAPGAALAVSSAAPGSSSPAAECEKGWLGSPEGPEGEAEGREVMGFSSGARDGRNGGGGSGRKEVFAVPQ